MRPLILLPAAYAIAIGASQGSACAQTGAQPWHNLLTMPTTDYPIIRQPSLPRLDPSCLTMDPPSPACVRQMRTRISAADSFLQPQFRSFSGFGTRTGECATKEDVLDALREVKGSGESEGGIKPRRDPTREMGSSSDIVEGVNGKIREGKTGTSNKNAAEQLKQLEKEEKDTNSKKPEEKPKDKDKKK